MNQLNKEFMISSYRNISFHMEERGESDFKYYNEILIKDLELLGENSGKYRDKFIEKVHAIYSAKSRQASAMIVGPANFKVTHKANESERKHSDHFNHWRERYFKLVNRVRRLSTADNVISDKEHLHKLEELKKKYKLEGKPHYAMTNLTTKIRYYKKKVSQLEARERLSEMFETIIVPNGKIYFDNDRLIVDHNDKPDKLVIEAIRSHGFKYSPKTTTWVRQFTGNAVHSARKLGVKLNE
jgi:hypothetical protein